MLLPTGTASNGHGESMTDRIETPRNASSGASELPPLRIYHLLLTTVVVATVTALYASLMQSRSSAPIPYFIYVLTLTIAQATAITTLALAFHWKRRGIGAVFDQPGNWLALALVTEVALSLIGSLLFSTVSGAVLFRPPFSLWASIILSSMLPRSCAGIALLLAAMHVGSSVAWRRFFLVAGAAQLVAAGFQLLAIRILPNIAISPPQFVHFAMLATRAAAYVGIPVLLLLAIRSDRRLPTRRHWSHWFGVAAWLCTTTANGFVAVLDFVRSL